jgi:thioredoxin reductase (NADPH)
MHDVVIIGAGPIGLACAIEAQRAGLDAVVVEKGALLNSFVGYPTNMELFSTPDLLEIGGYPLVSRGYKPIREEALEYYRRVAEAERVPLRLGERVERVDGEAGAFTVVTSRGEISCRFVIAATGFFDVPNRLDVPGEDLPKVSYYYKEPYAYAGRRVLIVGAKNSAAKAALECHRHGAEVTLVHRGPELSPSVKYWIRPNLLNRIEEGAIRAHFLSRVLEIRPESVLVLTPEGEVEIGNDVVLALVGYRPDYPFLERLGLDFEGPARVPVHNPETFETTRPGVFLAGTVLGGLNTSRWFIENGRFHAARIAEVLAARAAEVPA